MPPLWQYLLPLSQADESIPDPKGRESWTPSLFPCKSAAFRGPCGVESCHVWRTFGFVDRHHFCVFARDVGGCGGDVWLG